jgi:hypothetical protein
MRSKQRICCGDRYVTGIDAQCICRCLSDGLGDSGCYYYIAFLYKPFSFSAVETQLPTV